MGKKSGPKPGAGQAVSIASTTQAVASMSIGDGSATSTGVVSLFPPKPKRPINQIGPGNKVDLITNLFRLSLVNQEPIYRFDVNIDIIKDGEPALGVDKLPRKLNKEIRKQAIRKALDKWIKNNPQKSLAKKKYMYVYDNNASVIYALFKMFPDDKNSSLELTVDLDLDAIIDGKHGMRKETFQVKFFQNKTTSIDISKLTNYCKGIGSDITQVQECIRAINVILHGEIIHIDRFVVTPFSVFDFQGRKLEISPKVLLREGFSMSARPTATGMVLNVANSFNAFLEETDLLGILTQRFRVNDFNQPLKPYVIDELKRELKNKQIEARHINYGTQQRPHYRKYRVGSIEGDSLQKFMLVDKATKTSQEITIKDYFKKEYNINIKYPKLPCVVDNGRKIPLEVCHLLDKQRVTRKMTGDETANTIKAAAQKPDEHFRNIEKHVKTIQSVSRPLTDFGLNFDAKPIEVTGRELVPTFLEGQSKTQIRPSDGQYNVQRERFLKPATIGNWALVAMLDFDTERLKRNYPDLGSIIFRDLYSRAATQKGMRVGNMLPPREIAVERKSPDEIKRDLKKEFTLYNDKNVDHVIVLLSDRCPDYMYRYLQYLETLKLGVRPPGQKYTRVTCVKLKNYENKIVRIPERASMFVSNLLLKYNTKLGGINFALAGDPKQNKYLGPGYIFISLDVCHPAPGDKLAQSVAAAVGMWDLTSAERSYRTCIRVQRKQRQNSSTVEDVGEVDKMFEDILKAYYQRKGKKLPTNIVFLRDGVSEGQLKIVLESELTKIYAMMDRVYTNFKLTLPKVTCMVVQKRHKVRMMRKQPVQTRNGPDYNIQPGTVVDSEITHPTDFTFYLAPHKAIQGTSRAAHIYVIHDKIGFNQDEAQSMVHALSYLSPRCTKSTSIPTPVNLADRAAERGKNLVICWQEENMRGGKKGKGGDDVGFCDEQLIKLNDYLQNIGDPEYRNTLFYI